MSRDRLLTGGWKDPPTRRWGRNHGEASSVAQRSLKKLSILGKSVEDERESDLTTRWKSCLGIRARERFRGAKSTAYFVFSYSEPILAMMMSLWF